jgi:hypothetical protein
LPTLHEPFLIQTQRTLSNQAARSGSIFEEDRSILDFDFALASPAGSLGNEGKPWFFARFRESYVKSVLDLKTAKA